MFITERMVIVTTNIANKIRTQNRVGNKSKRTESFRDVDYASRGALVFTAGMRCNAALHATR